MAEKQSEKEPELLTEVEKFQIDKRAQEHCAPPPPFKTRVDKPVHPESINLYIHKGIYIQDVIHHK